MNDILSRRRRPGAGRRKSPFPLLLERLEERRMMAADITVNSTADTNLRDAFLTFREALLINNRTLSVASLSVAEQALVSGTPSAADIDTIQFNIPATDAVHVYYQDDGIGGQVTLANVATTTAVNDASIGDIDPDWAHSWFTIRPSTPLPSTFDPVTIDGYTQSGAAANTNAVGLGLNTVLKIEINGENAGTVVGSLRIEQGSGTTIRGLALNRAIGAEIFVDQPATNAVITGNFIGSDISGTRAFTLTLPPSPPGFLRSSGVYADAGGITIGGTTAAARNLISGNNLATTSFVAAVVLRGFNTPSTVQGNLIGPDRTGTVALGNRGSGILVDSQNNTLGGETTSAGNVISGNQSVSINLASLNANFTLIQNNKLGTNPAGTAAVGTTGGISIVNTASNNRILNNTIAFGTGIRAASGTGNLISQNSIFSNTGLGIDLGNDGVTPNDIPPTTNPPDQDNGPNKLQNFPIIASLTNLFPGTRIQGTLASTPNSNFRLEFFANAERDESNTSTAEGQTYLGFVNVSTNASGNATFSVDLAALPAGQAYVTATATDISDTGSGPANNTSEFSAVAVLGGVSFVVTNTGDSGPGSLREAIINANSTAGTQTITFAIPANDARHFYYMNDGIDGEVSLDHIAVTTEANDSNIMGIDPDWVYSWFSIKPESNLPKIVDTVVIDGYSQAGSSANTLPALEALNTILKIELDGENATGDGLSIGVDLDNATELKDASGSTVKGLAINRFGGDGIVLDTLDGGNLVAGNFIGTDVSGTLGVGNDGNGVFVDSERNSVMGGATAEARNLISGNSLNGTDLFLAYRSIVQGNVFGMDRNLARLVANGAASIYVHNTQPTANIATLTTVNAAVQVVKLDPDDVISAIENVCARSGSTGTGILLEVIAALPKPIGMSVLRSFWNRTFATSHNGGPNALHALSASAEQDLFLGIDRGNDGITPNVPGGLHNFPMISSASTVNGATTIAGTLNSVANTSFRIEFYSQSVGTNFRAGEKFLGFINIATNSQGNASFTFNSPEVVPLGQFVATTATYLRAGTLVPIETSEFSTPIAVGDTAAATQITVLGAERGTDTAPRVKVLDAKTGAFISTFLAYPASFHGGVRVATGDLTGDGIPEIITAPGAGREGLVKVFDLAGNELTEFRTIPWAGFTGGVFVAVGDVNGDGRLDLITTPDKGRKAEVRGYFNRIHINPSDPFTSGAQRKFLALGDTYTGGVTVAAGDITGDGKAEVVIGNRPGRAPLVRAFNLAAFAQASKLVLPPRLLEILPFKSSDRGGVSVAVGDVRSDSRAEIIVGNGTNGRSQMQVYNPTGGRVKTFTAYTSGNPATPSSAPVYVAAKDVDSDTGGDLLAEILTSQGANGSSKRLKSFQPDATEIDNVLQSEFDFRHGFFVA